MHGSVKNPTQKFLPILIQTRNISRTRVQRPVWELLEEYAGVFTKGDLPFIPQQKPQNVVSPSSIFSLLCCFFFLDHAQSKLPGHTRVSRTKGDRQRFISCRYPALVTASLSLRTISPATSE